MRKLLWLAPVIGAVGLAALLLPRHAATAPKDKVGEQTTGPALPISKVVLFSSGVGYFERKGEVEGNARVDLTFQVRDINDLIKSMVAMRRAWSRPSVMIRSTVDGRSVVLGNLTK